MFITMVFVAVFVVLLLVVGIIHRIYQGFALKHSLTITRLQDALRHYDFKPIKPIKHIDLANAYDDKNHYQDISEEDYLIYSLVNNINHVRTLYECASSNREQMGALGNELAIWQQFGIYDIAPKRKWLWLLKLIEKQTYKGLYPKPVTSFFVLVRLSLRSKEGEESLCKAKSFTMDRLDELYRRIQRKRGKRYLDQGIWDALCRVERGKVGWEVRKEVFTRDGCVCQKCRGRFPISMLEVDHIIPISKGGKSTMDNLQTLCHDCNYKKGSNIE